MHHPDILQFLKIRIPATHEFTEAGSIFPALWVSDLFMERMRKKQMWSLIDPAICDLSALYGEEYNKKYLELEASHNFTKINALELWDAIYNCIHLSGLPYICFKDNVNRFNNQSNLGVIKNSNLCTEIMEYSDNDEYAVCVLGSISLTSCVVTQDRLVAQEHENKLNTTDVSASNNNEQKLKFDFDKLAHITAVLVKNLNNLIDVNYYPARETYYSNLMHRPIGIGVQGLNDVYMLLRLPFDSAAAMELNKLIFETIDFASTSESARLSRELHKSHIATCREQGAITLEFYTQNPKFNTVDTEEEQDFVSGPLSQVYEARQKGPKYIRTSIKYTSAEDIPKISGAYPSMTWRGGSNMYKISDSKDEEHDVSCTFHWELYKKAREELVQDQEKSETLRKYLPSGLKYDVDTKVISDRYDWETLREFIKTFGVRNSLRVAVMPTASTSQLLGNNECIEPMTANLYTRKTVAGQFLIKNKYLMKDLHDLGLWDADMKTYLLNYGGSVKYIVGIPENMKLLYRTAYELSQFSLIQQAIDRQPFIDQAQSLNLYIENLEPNVFTKMMIYAWLNHLKTGKYYLHNRAATTPQKITIDPTKEKELASMKEAIIAINSADTTHYNYNVDSTKSCFMCSS
jgi:ribonucleotide reductase alpha subunit